MRQKFSLLMTLTAWLLATGSQWDLVQTYAWSRMIAGYAQRMSLEQAVEKTFAPGTMCRLCHAVAAAKQSEPDTPAVPASAPAKILLVFSPCPQPFAERVRTEEAEVSLACPWIGRDRPEPATPPPRWLS